MMLDFLDYEINMLTKKARHDCHIIESVLHQAGFDDNHSLLDIGCGPGSSTFVINEISKEASITGVDTKQEFITYAENMARNIDNLNFIIRDAENISFCNDKYDIVFSRNLFQYIRNPSNILNVMKKTARKNGKICIIEEDEHSLTIDPRPEFFDEMKISLLRLNKYTHANKFNLHQLSTEMTNQGMKSVEVKTYKNQIYDIESFNCILEIDEKTKWLLEYTGLLAPEKIKCYNQSILELIEQQQLSCVRTIISFISIVE